MSFSKTPEHENSMNTVPKQVLDVVNLGNSGMNSVKNLQSHLELYTLSTSTRSTTPVKSQSMQIFSNIEINGILVRGIQDTGAEINVMPLNVYD